jgi:hypothetical protein
MAFADVVFDGGAHALKKQHSKERRDLEETLIGPQPRMNLPQSGAEDRHLAPEHA